MNAHDTLDSVVWCYEIQINLVLGTLEIVPLMCALIESGSLNWPWFIKIFDQFVTHMCKFIGQIWPNTHYDVIDKNNNIRVAFNIVAASLAAR